MDIEQKKFKSITKTLFQASLWILASLLLIILFLYGIIAPGYYIESGAISSFCYFIIILLILFIYTRCLKKYHTSTLFSSKYFQNNHLKWSGKITLLFILHVLLHCLLAFFYTEKPENQKNLDANKGDFLPTLFEVGVKAPILEEVVLRGLLFILVIAATSFWFKSESKSAAALRMSLFIIISTSLFGLFHVIDYGDYQHIAPYLVGGFVFCIAFVLTRNIIVPIILHMYNNASIVLNEFGYTWITTTMDFIFVFLALISVFNYFHIANYTRQLMNKYNSH